MITARNLRGCYVAIITPMTITEGNSYPQVDLNKMYSLIRENIDAGVTGLVFAGTTGQSATLSHDEHVEVATKGAAYAHWYSNETGKNVQIIAGAGSNSTNEAISLSERITAAAPIDALLHVTGYYNNPPQEGLVAHFEAVAEAMAPHRTPIILYNVPGRTSSNLSAETIIQLSKHPNIIGVKEASGDLEKIEKIIAETDRKTFQVVSGEDHLVYDIMKRGGTGVISAAANRWPREFQVLTELAEEEKWEEAEELQKALLPCVKAVFCAKNPIPLCHMFGSEVRLPLVKITQLADSEKYENIISEAMAIETFPHVTECVGAE